MGLDSVEIVAEVEDRFGVQLPDSECHRIRTVADLAALVIRHLPHASSTCATSRTFYQIRRLIMQYTGEPRWRVRPTVRLDMLIPTRSRRKVWHLMRRTHGRMPELVPRDSTDRVMLALTLMLLFAIVGVCGWAWFVAAGTGLMLAALGSVASLFLLAWICRLTWRHYPPGCETVGDLARQTAPIELPGTAGARLLLGQSVLAQVRQITAHVLGVDIQSVRGDSDFVNDLNID